MAQAALGAGGQHGVRHQAGGVETALLSLVANKAATGILADRTDERGKDEDGRSATHEGFQEGGGPVQWLIVAGAYELYQHLAKGQDLWHGHTLLPQVAYGVCSSSQRVRFNSPIVLYPRAPNSAYYRSTTASYPYTAQPTGKEDDCDALNAGYRGYRQSSLRPLHCPSDAAPGGHTRSRPAHHRPL